MVRQTPGIVTKQMSKRMSNRRAASTTAEKLHEEKATSSSEKPTNHNKRNNSPQESNTDNNKRKKKEANDTNDHDEANNETSNYASQKYWDDRYKEKNIDHEWYYSFDILEPIITQARTFTSSDKVLELGCGDRPLIQDFKKFHLEPSSLYAIDFSDAVIADLKKSPNHIGIHLESMDARKLTFADESFHFIIEKGTIDAMLSAKKQSEGLKNANQLVEQAIRTLTKDGVFIIISHIRVDSDEFELLMDEVIMPGLEYKSGVNWDITVHSVKENGTENENGEVEAKYGTVYVISSKQRRVTRGGDKSKGSVSFQVMEYSDSEGDEGEEEDGEEYICMPCSR
jgi:SAM-dependent methyltransferase